MTKRRKRMTAREMKINIARSMWGGFYRCPNTGKILEQLPGDNKVLCSCGKSNPLCLGEETERTATHLVRFLQSVTVEEYIDERIG